MALGNELQKDLEKAISETPKDMIDKLTGLGRQSGNSYGKFLAEVFNLPWNYQTILMASFLDGAMEGMCEENPTQADKFMEFVGNIFSMRDGNIME